VYKKDQDKNWETFLSGNGANNDPEPEDCPHCLNRGGSLAQCGTYIGTNNNNQPFERNYDTPHNGHGQPMPPNIQATYTAGSIIEIDVMVTTHHRGHFEFAICPIVLHDDDDDNSIITTKTTNAATATTEAISSPTSIMPIPTKECFDENKLTFLSDELYGAPRDVNYPERGYLAPASIAEWTNGDPGEQPVFGAEYKMRYQLPTSSSSSSTGVVGDVVLLQWYYLTANSCKHPGYAEYPFPAMWGDDVDFYPGLPDCEHVPEDGNGVPEQFWNCAEIRIVSSDDKRPEAGQQQQHDDDDDDEDEDTSSSILPIDVVGHTVTRPTRPEGSYVVISESSTTVITAAEKELAMLLESEPSSSPPSPRPSPPPRPTKIPTQNPTTPMPTRSTTTKPTIRQTRRPTTVQQRPTSKPIRQTRRPTPRPTPKPIRRPSKRPTSRPSPSTVLTLYQKSKPTKRPHQQQQQQQQRPRTSKPTRKPTTTRRPTKNYVLLSPSESYIVPVSNNNNNNKPSKGQEQQQQSSSSLGDRISNQITTAAATNKKKPKRQQQLQKKKQKQKLKRQKKKENMLKKKRKRQEMKRKRVQKKESNFG